MATLSTGIAALAYRPRPVLRTLRTRISTSVSTRHSTRGARLSRAPVGCPITPVTISSTSCRPGVMIWPASPSTRTLTPQRRRLMPNLGSSCSAGNLNAAPMANRLFTKTAATCAQILPPFFQRIISKVKMVRSMGRATMQFAQSAMITWTAVTEKTSPKHGAAPENLLLARRSSSSSLEEVVAALQANLHLHAMDTIREQDPLRRSASSLSPWPSPSLLRERHRMAFAHQEDVCAVRHVLQL